MKLSEFQENLREFDGQAFENFVFDVVRSTQRFRSVEPNVVIAGRQVDLVAIEDDRLTSDQPHWIFEIKAYKRGRLSIREIDQLAGLALDLSREVPRLHLVLVTTAPPTQSARSAARHANVEIWDPIKLVALASKDILGTYFGAEAKHIEQDHGGHTKAMALVESLEQIPAGRAEWSAYQHLVGQIFEFLFCPPLDAPRNEVPDKDSRNRRDMILENSASEGFWARLRSDYSAHYIVVDAKNHAGKLTKRPILDVAHYLKPHGCGMFAIIASRKGTSEAAWHAVREHWIASRKLILIVDDGDIKEMIGLKTEAGDPEDLLRRRISDFRMSM